MASPYVLRPGAGIRRSLPVAPAQESFLTVVIGTTGGLLAGVAFGFEVGNPGPGVALASRLGLVVPLIAFVGGLERMSVASRVLVASVGSVLCVLLLSPVVERALRTLG